MIRVISLTCPLQSQVLHCIILFANLKWWHTWDSSDSENRCKVFVGKILNSCFLILYLMSFKFTKSNITLLRHAYRVSCNCIPTCEILIDKIEYYDQAFEAITTPYPFCYGLWFQDGCRFYNNGKKSSLLLSWFTLV